VCTLDVVKFLNGQFHVYGLSTNRSVDRLCEQIDVFHPEVAVIVDETRYSLLKEKCSGKNLRILAGIDGLCELAGHDDVDILMNATVGSVGLFPTLEAIKKGKKIAMANKETIVAFGSVLMEEAKRTGSDIIPVDSEHSAIHQCLAERNAKALKRIVLTASGGPFFNANPGDMKSATKKAVLAHPVWKMGRKITVDSATLMNKGFEVVEAHFLFGMSLEKIDVLIHPQAVVHSMVEFEDSSILAQLSSPDMRLPIQYALTFPERFPSIVNSCDLTKVDSLEFKEVDANRFPCLALGYRAVEKNGTATAVLSAADEVVVESFLNDSLSFGDIPFILNKILEEYEPISSPSLQQLIEEEKWAKEYTRTLIDRWCSR
jgi:1-deoxy-D-xylulose-5-phosphate reductoisomerase